MNHCRHVVLAEPGGRLLSTVVRTFIKDIRPIIDHHYTSLAPTQRIFELMKLQANLFTKGLATVIRATFVLLLVLDVTALH